MKKEVEILCLACGEESLLVRSPKYEGFAKVGEILTCCACGQEYASETDVPFKTESGPDVFDESDRSRDIRIFSDSEKGHICRYCAHYVVNPFTQRCSKHLKTVEATDSCGDFEDNCPDDIE